MRKHHSKPKTQKRDMTGMSGSTQPSHQVARRHEYDDNSPILGTDLEEQELGTDYQQKMQKTMEHVVKVDTRRDHRNRIVRIINFWKKNCPQYYLIAVRKNTPKEMYDEPLMWFFKGKYKEDIIYTGLNPKFVLAFLNDEKIVKHGANKGNYRSYDDMRKFRDAINNGAKIRSEKMPHDFHVQIEQYLKAYKKEFKKEKKNGNAESKDADPISFELYKQILAWAIEDGLIMVFFWTQTQWSCMSRCASIDPLGFQHYKVYMDTHQVLHDLTKADQAGERCFAKHIYANGQNWLLCQWTGMGLYCACRREKFVHGDSKFFAEPGTEEGSAAKKYQELLRGMLQKGDRSETVRQHCRLDHFNAYGLRKGPASHATSGTTMPPSLPAIAHRGDWSMGAVFDAYFKFMPAGDHYLGQILSGKDPNLASFKDLPPHWTVKSTHPEVEKALIENFGPILENHGATSYDPTGLLVRCLACMVYHSEEILQVIYRHPGQHPFSFIPLYSPRSNLPQLRPLVTTEPTPYIMETATGIPPHVEVACQLREMRRDVLGLIEDTKAYEVRRQKAEQDFKEKVTKVVQDAIETNNVNNGNVSGLRLQNILKEYQQKTESRLTKLFDDFIQKHGQQRAPVAAIQQETTTNGLLSADTNMFQYRGRYWFVPEDFAFPKPTLSHALRLWLKGSAVNGDKVVRPYRLLKKRPHEPDCLPNSKLRQQFNNSWQQFFNFIDSAEVDGAKWNSDWPADTSLLTQQQIETAETKMWAILKARVSYKFRERGKAPQNRALASWAKAVAPSQIQKLGTQADKSFLTGTGAAKRKTAKRKRELKQGALYPQRQRPRVQPQQLLNHPVAGGQTSIQNLMDRGHQEDVAQGRRAPNRRIVDVNRDVETSPTHLQWLIDTFGNNATGCRK